MFEDQIDYEEQKRDIELETMLNQALADGHNVWAIGDVHGYAEPLTHLLDRLDLSPDDHVVLLGDLIDRGPDSALVIQLVRENEWLHAIKGNHEDMMITALDEMERVGLAGPETLKWICNGGDPTLDSFDALYGNTSGPPPDVKRWLRERPSQIVLDGFRLVHAGYDPILSLENNTDAEMLSIRSQFHSHPEPLDPERQIVFGHTQTWKIKVDGKTPGVQGQPLRSHVHLKDGRSSWVGIETGACLKPKYKPTLTAYDLQAMVFEEVRMYD